jgi:hypothetical protein
MSSLRSIDLMTVDDLVDFVRGRGYVLNFSDASFTQFFASELDVDINDTTYSERGASKGKRLRCFLEKVNDQAALQALYALWEYRRAFFLQTGQDDPIANAEARYLNLVNRLSGGPNVAPKGPQESAKTVFDQVKLGNLRDEVIALSEMPPQARGYAFEGFLNSLFELYGLKPRDAFRNRGEQIDGSFVLAGEIYLMEAKWQSAQTGVGDLRAFNGKVEEKTAWTRGLFVSHSGFTADGLYAFGRGKRIICMDGLDLYETLRRGLPLDHVLDQKIRRAAETGRPFIPIRELFPG